MRDNSVSFGPSLRGLSLQEWLDEISELVEYDGFFQPLGTRHWAAFTEHSKTLLVTFESVQSNQAFSPNGHPLGWDMVKRLEWSHLGVFCDGDTWFRDPAVYAFFDRLIDDGFFDEFERVIFYGTGPCGYAACAYSVSAPGASVLALQPQATLAPDLTEWDKRFVEQRRLDFDARFGFAPDMTEAAGRVFIVFDPDETEDAMHAALFRGVNVQKLRMRRMGGALQLDLLQMCVLHDLLEAVGQDRLTPYFFAETMRARRYHLPYLRRLLARLDAAERPILTHYLCHNVTRRLRAPRFAKRLEAVPKNAS
ncbi:MAG: phosphoadenosine phosphosulfate reductase [Pseudomonadota bacterium]